MKFNKVLKEYNVEFIDNVANFYKIGPDGKTQKVNAAKIGPNLKKIILDIAKKLKAKGDFKYFKPKNFSNYDVVQKSDGTFDITDDKGEKYILKV